HLDDLASDDPEVRDPAEDQLRRMGADAIRPLFKIYRREKRRMLPDLDLFALLTGLFLIPFIVCVTLAFLGNVAFLPGLMLGMMLFVMTVWAYKSLVDKRVRRLELRKRKARRRVAEISGL